AEFGEPPVPGAAIIIRDNGPSGKAAQPKALGDASSPEDGWNDFLLSIEGFAVINERGETIPMQSNYWGVTEPEEFNMRVDGPAVLEPVLSRSSAILAASVFCTVWDSVDQKRLGSASVALRISNFSPVTENTDGIYAFPAMSEGVYDLFVNATGYEQGILDIEVGPGELKSVVVPMNRLVRPDDGGNNGGGGGGCSCPETGGKSLEDLQGDLFLAGLTLLA